MALDRHSYPFTAIVGQDEMKMALVLNAINPTIGGVLIRGEKGTGKSTAVRALARLLPEQKVVEGCHFGCHPEDPEDWCLDCRERAASGSLPSTTRRMRVVELPINASEDRVVGTIDLEAALKEGSRRFEPGVLAEANRNILYVDEVNLLDDHIVDVLLDAAALGVNVVEREGVSVSHPARFLLVGTMNEDEGELRPQIADRIGLELEVAALDEPAGRAEVIRRREAFTADPDGFCARWSSAQADLAAAIAAAEAGLPQVRVPDALYAAVGELVVRSGVNSHRADIAIVECAKALAALGGRNEVDAEDVLEAAGLALGHRLAVDPFAP